MGGGGGVVRRIRIVVLINCFQGDFSFWGAAAGRMEQGFLTVVPDCQS